jgi:crotonobetainyl-CoA:carnitine CoA-transferase CaiB-like acyl-CoA transferase
MAALSCEIENKVSRMTQNAAGPASYQPLAGLKVVDFSTLLPGPLAALMLADAGADVTKIERPGTGEDMRAYDPKIDGDSANFLLLNRGKNTRELNLKDPEDNAAAKALVAEADILIEQFRPGVMDRLGLSYEALSEINPGLIYCSITGYGQTGPKAQLAAHDLNYVGDAGMLSLVVDKDGTPTIPAIALADIGGGAYPAVINIMYALTERAKTGRGRHLDISMSDNVFPFLYWAMGNHLAGKPARPSEELTTGGSPRYAIYRTKDDRFVVAAPLEDKFWANFCRILEIDLSSGKSEVAARIAARTSDEWLHLFEGQDVCCSLVRTIEEALADPHFNARGCFARQVATTQGTIPGLPLASVPDYRDPTAVRAAPGLASRKG